MEMQTFNGKRDINEGETASTMSQSRVSGIRALQGKQIAQKSQAQFGGMAKRPNEGRKGVQFADADDGSPSHSPDNMREGKDGIRKLDKALADGQHVDQLERQISSLEDFSKQKSRFIRDL